MDDKTRVYAIKNPVKIVMIAAKRIAMKTKIERSLFFRKAIRPVTRLIREQIPATERGRRGRGKGSVSDCNKSWSVKNDIMETAMRVTEDLPKRVVAKRSLIISQYNSTRNMSKVPIAC
jgi:hypothetical protein